MKKILLPIVSLALGIATAGANVIINPPAPTSSANYTASFTETDSGGIYSYSDTAGPGATPGIVTPTEAQLPQTTSPTTRDSLST